MRVRVNQDGWQPARQLQDLTDIRTCHGQVHLKEGETHEVVFGPDAGIVWVQVNKHGIEWAVTLDRGEYTKVHPTP